MRQFSIILCFAVFVFTLAAAETPPIIRDTGEHSAGDFAGDWNGYWLRGKKLAGKTNTIFRLTPQGEWHILLNGKDEKAGTFRATDSFIMFKRTPKSSEKDADATEEPELLAHLIDRNGFLIRAAGQPNIAMVYRRVAAIPDVKQEEVKGEWRLFEENSAGEERRAADFGIVFDGKGNYSTVKYDNRQIIPEGAEKGTYTLKQDEVILKNECKLEDSPWNRMRFFKVFDELILDTPQSIVYAVKQ